jgi:hypothetical protein
VNARDEVVVISAEEFRRLTSSATGQSLVNALQASPYREVEIEPARSPLAARDVVL